MYRRKNSGITHDSQSTENTLGVNLSEYHDVAYVWYDS